MDGYLQIHSGLIRIGPDAHVFPDPYEIAISFSANKGFATLQGLVIPKDRLILPDGTFKECSRYTVGQGREIYDIAHRLCRDYGLTAIFERKRNL